MNAHTQVADLVIRNGLVVDGSGAEPFEADVAIAGDRIIAVGEFKGRGREEIDAKGKIVTPGFIDVHTHYDAQLTWASEVSPSSSHGVTTVVTGNCAVGFAPCRPKDREALVNLLDGVEDVPGVVLREGLTWDWETFPEYLAAVERRPHDIDFAIQMAHGPLRIYVMGDRALDDTDDAATEEDLALMRKLVREGIEAGAVGFGTSRNIFHVSRDGKHISSVFARQEELRAIAKGVADAGGVLQVLLPVIGGHDVEEFKMFRDISAETGVPFSYTIGSNKYEPESWRELLDLTSEANASGVSAMAQTFCRPTGILLGLDLSYNPFSRFPTYREIEGLPLADRVAEMRKPDVRARILADGPDDQGMNFHTFARDFHNIFPLRSISDYEPNPSNSVAAQAAKRGISPFELAYDMLLEDEGKAMLFCASTNFETGNLQPVIEMMNHPFAVLGLGDGGAHYAMISDSNYPSFMLSYWARDRAAGKMPLAKVVNLMTRRPALMMRFADRGLLSPGFKADLNVIDLANLSLGLPKTADDLPSGARRIVQNATGYSLTVVSGEIIVRDDKHTGAMPGQLVRRTANKRPSPNASRSMEGVNA